MTNAKPQDAQYNPYNPTSCLALNNWATYPLYDRFLRYIPANGKYETRIVSDYTFNNNQVDLEIGGHGHTWHDDGSPVTAQDIHTQLKLWKYAGQGIWNLLDSIEVVDDQTLRLHLNGGVNQDLLLQDLVYFQGTVKHDVFSDLLNEIENASGKDARQQAVAKLLKWRLEEPVGTGPFKFTKTTPNALITERYNDYPWADKINFSGYEAKPLNENSVRIQALQSGELDVVSFFVIDETTQEQLPEYIKRIDTPSNGGYALHYNHANEHLGKRKVRQAIAHVINRADIVSNIGGEAAGNQPLKYPAGTKGGNDANSFNNIVDDAAGFYKYGPNSSNEEEASKLLKSAGYSKQNGSWTNPNGKKLSFELLGPTWDVMSTACETINSQLSRFGINVELSISEPSAFEDRYQNSDFELTYRWWGGGAIRMSSYFSYLVQFSSDEQREQKNYPKEVDVPWPPGDGSKTKKVDVEKLLSEAATLNGDKAKEKLRELAWIDNRDLPILCITSRSHTQFQNTRRWNLPEDQDADTSRVIESNNPNMSVLQPYEWLPRKGLLTANSNS